MGTEYIYIYSHILEYGYIIKEKRNKGYKIIVNMSWEGKKWLGKGEKIQRRQNNGREDSM